MFTQVYPILPSYDKIREQTTPATEPESDQMSDQPDEILTIEEVAAYLKAGKRTVYRLAANGQIPAFKLGGTWRFRRGDLDRWIASRIDKAMMDDDEGAE
jgi:excisionase family DNA binding protein